MKTLITRVSLALAALAVGGTMPATAVHAHPPDRIPSAGAIPPFDVKPAQTGCGAVTLTIVDNQNGAVFYDQVGNITRMHFAGQVTVRVAGEGDTIDLRISGPTRIADEVVLTGPMLLFAREGMEAQPLLEYVRGRTVVGGGGLDNAAITGRRVDLCPIVGA